MSDEQMQQRMAEYLGGEMSPAQRADFERELAERPDLRQQLRQLQGTLGLVEQAWAPPRHRVARQVSAKWRYRLWQVASYAAAVAIAFAAGYGMPRSADQPQGPHPGSEAAVTDVLARDQQLAAALGAVPADAGFTRSILVAAAYAAGDAEPPR